MHNRDSIAKKGQEEVVGFVAIVVIVAIVFVIILALFLRSDTTRQQPESKDIEQFLTSALTSTTSCALNYEPNYASLGTLLGECYTSSRCTSGESACIVLNQTLQDVLHTAFPTGEDRPIKGYMLNATYGSNSSRTQEHILSLSAGNCTFRLSGADHVQPLYPGRIITSLYLCY